MKRIALGLSLSVVASVAPVASAAAADKSGYTLFNPTPREQMRELSTDRPDQTESPYTVDAGHWQVELDFATYTDDRDAGTRTRMLNIAPVNVKLGLTNTTDVQLMFDSYVRERIRSGTTATTTDDWGDITVRLKQNIWGNDGGDTAFAVMPFIKLPPNTGDTGNDLVEGGMILPLAINTLPGGWGLGLMTEVDWLADDSGQGRHTEWVNTITFSRDLLETLGWYVEFVSIHSTETSAAWLAQADTGFTYAVSADVQLDAGCNFGLTEAAPDVQPFIGLTVRY